MRDGSSAMRSWDELWPELADDVSVDAPLHDGAPWVIAVSKVPRARVGVDFARLAASFDGRRSLREAADAAGLSVGPAQALDVVDALAAADLLRSGSPAVALRARPGRRTLKARAAGRRLQYRAPLTVQWTILDPSALARTLAAPIRLRAFRVVLYATVAVLLVLAGVGIAVDLESIIGVLAAPLPIDLVPVLILAVALTGCVHELGHAVMLAALGGRPTRMGIMLFYLMPAFFCDVTDGWRIGGRRSRAAVALAGPAIHLVLASASFALVPVVGDANLRALLALYGFACLVAVVANLVPFIKLDGYLALVAITDTPYLRRVAMTAARRGIARMLFGVDLRPDAPRDAFPLIAFGALCTLFPLLLFLWGAIRLQSTFLDLGHWSAMSYLALVATFLIVTARRIVRFATACLRLRPRARRIGFALGVALTAGSLLVQIPVPATAHAGYVVRADHVFVVSSSQSIVESLRPGGVVRLRTNGVVLRSEVGTAAVPDDPSRPTEVTVPVSAAAPVSAPGTTVTAWGIPLTKVESLDPLPAAGIADIELADSLPLGEYAVGLLIGEPLSAVFEGVRQ